MESFKLALCRQNLTYDSHFTGKPDSFRTKLASQRAMYTRLGRTES